MRAEWRTIKSAFSGETARKISWVLENNSNIPIFLSFLGYYVL
jgi:hypothetical protein